MTGMNYKHVIGIPASYQRAPNRLLFHPFSDEVYDSSKAIASDKTSQIRHSKLLFDILKLAKNVKRKLSLGARILQVGGMENIFRQNFTIREGEKLLKASQCYLSTTSGPIAGILFTSADKVAFCSDRSIKVLSPSGKCLKIRYKILIPLIKLKRANASHNLENPLQKYIEVVTEDKYDFWFMGFRNHRSTLGCLQQAIDRCT